MLLLFIIGAFIIFSFVAYCIHETKPDNAWKYCLNKPEGEKQKLRIQRTALPDKRLKRNDWHKHIHELRNGKK